MDKIKIKDKSYEEDFVEKAIFFYTLLQDGSINEQVKEEYKCLK